MAYINTMRIIPRKEYEPPTRVSVDPNTCRVAKYLAAYLGFSVAEIIGMAMREFASRRLPTGWEEDQMNEDNQ